MTVYKWKAGARALNCDAQTAGEVCSELDRAGMLSPSTLVDVSRPTDAPLHDAFEWDNDVAAEMYREVQAGHIIRSVEVVVTGTAEPTRAFVNVSMTGTRHYTNIVRALECKDGRESLLQQAKNDMQAFKRKYSQLRELASVIKAMDKAIEG